MRFRVVVEYDGTDYHGFQRQRELPTIQGEIERALYTIVGSKTTVLGAGRTDSGVHAFGQVIAFDLGWKHSPQALKRALNARLPADIAVADLSETSETFHPRYSAIRRTYEYRIYNAPDRSPIHRRSSWHVRQPLDLELMNRAAEKLIGVNDFATFGQPTIGPSSIRQVYRAEWRKQDGLLKFYIEANAFLYRMVRSIVGSMKCVGERAWSMKEFEAAFEARERSRSGQTAPPHGLFLLTVTYE